MAEERRSSGQYDSRYSNQTNSSSSLPTTPGAGYPGMDREEGYGYDFIDKAGDKYDCPICLLVLREPLQTECGHRFCRACILRWLREAESRCPVDNTPLEEHQLFPDNFAKREILSLQVKCPNFKQGCDFIVILKQLQEHLEKCRFSLVPCPNQCSSILLRHDIPSHVMQTCPKREVQCQYCQLKVAQELLENHSDSCSAVPLTCPFCVQALRRDQMQSHVDDVCPKAIVKCQFYPLGCKLEMERRILTQHMQEFLQGHLQLLCNGVVTVLNVLGIPQLPAPSGVNLSQPGTVPSEISGSPDSIGSNIPAEGQEAVQSLLASLNLGPAPSVAPLGASLPTALSGVQRTASFLENVGQTAESEGELSGEQTVEVSQVSYTSNLKPSKDLQGAPRLSLVPNEVLQSLKSQNLYQDESLARHEHQMMEILAKCEHTERINRELKSKIRSFENTMSEFEGRACNGYYIWKITTYNKLRREAELGETTAFHSPAFYSGCYGYKLCVRVNLNGVDSAKGTHLSIFIHFMQGEYDDILEWPFSGRIILSVMDQNPQCEARHHVVETLLAKPGLAAFQRATTPRNHKGFGYMEFLPLSVLDKSTYVRNDTLIIRAQVIPSG